MAQIPVPEQADDLEPGEVANAPKAEEDYPKPEDDSGDIGEPDLGEDDEDIDVSDIEDADDDEEPQG
jgi:hypothetical protein